MSNDRDRTPSPVSTFSIFLVGIAGVLITVLKPALLSSYVSHGGIDEIVAGYMISLEIVAAFLGTLLIALRGHIWDRRRAVIIGLGLLLGGNLLTAGVQGPVLIACGRLIAGLGEGLAVGLFAASLAGYPKPERLFGASTVITLLIGAGAYQLVPIVLAWRGIAGFFLLVCVPVLLALLFSSAFPSRPLGRVAVAGKVPSAPLPLSAAVLAGGTIAYYVSVGGVWPYMGQIGVGTHLSAEAVSRIFGYSQLWGAVAAALAVLAGDRFGRALPIAASVTLGVICLFLLLALPGQPRVFALVAQAFMFGWLLFFPYLMGLTSSLDPVGRLSSLVYTAQSIGFFLGPALCAQAIRIGSYEMVLWFGVLCFATTLVVLLPVAIKQDRRDARMTAIGEHQREAPGISCRVDSRSTD